MLEGIMERWKAIVSLIVVVVAAAFSVWSWAADTKEDILKEQKAEMVLMEAQSAIIHNDYYQEGRITRKEDQVTENKRELDNLLEKIGDDEQTPRETREIEYLDAEILRLRTEIEVIRVTLKTE